MASDLPLPPGVRLPDRTVWINGRLCRGVEAALSLFDRGARDGEGLFETLRIERGRPLEWQRHLERLVLSAAELGFPVPAAPSLLRGALDQVLKAEGLTEAAARITVTRGVAGGRPTRAGVWVEAEPLAGRLWSGTRSGEARVIFSRVPFEPGPLGRHKTIGRLAYHLAREEARAAGADEALLVTPLGQLLEGSVSNLFAVAGGEVLTPPLAAGILPGIVRARVLGLCAELGIPAREQPISQDHLVRAEEIFLTNSIQQVVPVAALEGHSLRRRDIGARMRAAYRDALGRDPE